MIFPLSDDNRDRRIFPLINYLIIAVNIFVFVYFQDFGNNQKFTFEFSTVPQEILSGKDIVNKPETFQDPETGQRYQMPGLQPTPVPVYLTIITSMFMHGGIAHIFGNMIFLFVFGDNIENRIGHLRYLIFYLICGILASIAYVYSAVLLNLNLLIPTLGASGAISGVLGAYILLYPKRRVSVLIFYFITNVSAFFAIGLWILFQLISSFGLLGGSDSGGIAYGAHIGGFLAGLVLIKFFTIGK